MMARDLLARLCRNLRRRSGLDAAALLLVCLLAMPGHAQQSGPATFSQYPQSDSLEGGDSVVEGLTLDDTNVGSVLRLPAERKFFDPWFAWKKRVNDDIGLQLNFSYQALYQNTEADVPYQDAFAGRGQIDGAWTFLNRGGKNPGKLTFRLENRNTIDTEIPPSQLAFQFGSVSSSGTGFSNFSDPVMSELAWRQATFDGRFKFILGKISAISWYNTQALSSSLRGFQNTAVQSSLSKPAPGRGIGGGVGLQFSPHFVMVAGIHDANAKTDQDPFDTIDEWEFYKSVEFRWYPTTPDRWRFDKVTLQFWHQDELSEKGIPASQGVTFQASQLFNDKWYPFVLGGISDGKASIFEADLVAGLGIALNPRQQAARDVFGIAASWGDPAEDGLNDQTTAELFYRLQLLERLALTPSIQYVRDPAASPTEEDAWVVGLRARVSF